MDDLIFVTSDFDRAKVNPVMRAMIEAANNQGAHPRVMLAAALNLVGYIIATTLPDPTTRLTVTDAAIQAIPLYVGAYMKDCSTLP